MGGGKFLFDRFIAGMKFEPTVCQRNMLKQAAEFIYGEENDILVVNGYAGTGKTTAVASVIKTMKEFGHPCVLLAPTGRAAKVLSNYAGQSAYTIHKHIYRQKSVGGDGYGQFSLAPNKAKETLFIVDEVSLISIESGQSQSTQSFGSGNLLDDLIGFVRNGLDCKVMLIGDSAQLPPVGLDASPALSRDYMLMMGGVDFVNMTTVVRQEQKSGILYNATVVRDLIAEAEELSCSAASFEWEDLHLDVSAFNDVERITGGELIEKISDAYSRYGEDEVTVLCRSNKRAIDRKSVV